MTVNISIVAVEFSNRTSLNHPIKTGENNNNNNKHHRIDLSPDYFTSSINQDLIGKTSLKEATRVPIMRFLVQFYS